jgi:nitrogen regulatory protein P-II 1
MTRLECIIRPDRFDDVYAALEDAGIRGMTVTEIRGRGQQQGYVERFGGMEYALRLIPKMKLELVVTEDRVDEIVRTVQQTAHTGEAGDGKIFIQRIDDVVRIRTGERGEAAI